MFSMLQYEAMRMEKLVFSTREFKCHMSLVHDYSTDPTQILRGQHEAADWLDIDSGVTECVYHLTYSLRMLQGILITDWFKEHKPLFIN